MICDYEHESTPKCEGSEFFAGTEGLLAAAVWALQCRIGNI
jgi:hypothetical protein